MLILISNGLVARFLIKTDQTNKTIILGFHTNNNRKISKVITHKLKYFIR